MIGQPAETAHPDPSLEEYLETVAAIGGLTFIPSRRRVASVHPHMERGIIVQ